MSSTNTALVDLVAEIANAIVDIDRSEPPHKSFRAGAGPFGEPQLVRMIANRLDKLTVYKGLIEIKRSPDMLIRNHWAVEFKIARPFGDNGNEAENWSVNLLHPYEGNASAVGDALKLLRCECAEQKAVVVIGYEHTPPRIDLERLLSSFEAIACKVTLIRIGPRTETIRPQLVHPVHQQVRVVGWEILGK